MGSSNAMRKSVTVFQWQIENISFWHSEIHGQKLMSPQFVSSSFKRNNLCLLLFPNGFADEDERVRVMLYPHRLLLPVTIDCEVSILGDNRSPLLKLISSNWEIKKDTPLCLPPGPPFVEVFATQKSMFLPRDTLTLQCQVTRSDGVGDINEYYFARTRIEVRETTFLWPKKCFRTLELNKSVTISLLLTLFPRDFVKFTCKQTLTGTSLEDSRLELEIGEVGNNEKMLLKSKLSLLDNSMRTVTFKEKWSMFGLPTGLGSQSLPGYLRKEVLKKGIGTLSLSIAFATSHKSETIERSFKTPGFNKYLLNPRCRKKRQNGPSEGHTIQYKTNSTTSLVESLFNMYLDRTLSDFELQSEGVSFPVHKNILCARSPVFRTLMIDKNECKSMEILDLDASTLSSMLRFIYGGSLDTVDWKAAVKLYRAALLYQIPPLQKECVGILQCSVEASNVCEILAQAYRYNDKELVSIANDFISENIDAVMMSEEWDRLMEIDANLAGEALKAFIDTLITE